jgi:hypothetical protein
MPTEVELKAAQEAEAAAQAAAAAAQAANPPAPLESDDPKVLKAEVERLRKIATANGKEAAANRVKLRAVEEERQKAEQDRLASEGKFKELAESRAKEIEGLKQELEPLRSTAATYQQRETEERQRREAQVAADFAALPEDVRADLPDDADLRMKEFAVKQHQKASGQKPRPPTTTPTAPRPASTDSKPPYTADQISAFNQIVANTRLPAAKRDEARAALKKAAAWKAEHPGQ